MKTTFGYLIFNLGLSIFPLDYYFYLIFLLCCLIQIIRIRNDPEVETVGFTHPKLGIQALGIKVLTKSPHLSMDRLKARKNS